MFWNQSHKAWVPVSWSNDNDGGLFEEHITHWFLHAFWTIHTDSFRSSKSNLLRSYYLGYLRNLLMWSYAWCYALSFLQRTVQESVLWNLLCITEETCWGSSLLYQLLPLLRSIGGKFLSDTSARKSFSSSENLVFFLLMNNEDHGIYCVSFCSLAARKLRGRKWDI